MAPMRHDPIRLAYKCREQACLTADREAAALLRGMAGDLEELAGLMAFLRHPANRERFSARRHIPRSARRP